jgi:hypothetical protein
MDEIGPARSSHSRYVYFFIRSPAAAVAVIVAIADHVYTLNYRTYHTIQTLSDSLLEETILATDHQLQTMFCGNSKQTLMSHIRDFRATVAATMTVSVTTTIEWAVAPRPTATVSRSMPGD